MRTEPELIGLCLALNGRRDNLSEAELALTTSASTTTILSSAVAVRRGIARGADPLGDAFFDSQRKNPSRRRGRLYAASDREIDDGARLARQPRPDRIVDPGAGPGRFLLAAGTVFPDARLVAVELDPLAALMLRANLTAHGWTGRALWSRRNSDASNCSGLTPSTNSARSSNRPMADAVRERVELTGSVDTSPCQLTASGLVLCGVVNLCRGPVQRCRYRMRTRSCQPADSRNRARSARDY